MKTKLIILSMVVVMGGAQFVFAHEGHDDGDEKGSMMMDHDSMMGDKGMMDHKMGEETTKAVEVGNKICPVSGDKILAPGEKGAMGETVKYEYNGKIYNLCCEMCVKDFKKDPEKYSKIAEEEAKKSQEQGENVEHKEGDGHEHHNHGK